MSKHRKEYYGFDQSELKEASQVWGSQPKPKYSKKTYRVGGAYIKPTVELEATIGAGKAIGNWAKRQYEKRKGLLKIGTKRFLKGSIYD